VKTCKSCGATKPLADFYGNPSGRDGTRPECKDCTRARRKRWYTKNREREIERVADWQRENPERVRAAMDRFRAAGKKKVSDRKSHLKRKYGITLEDFDTLLASQGGGCAICGKPDVDHVDHDHVTGRVRGILCFRCNVAIGQMDDDCDRLAAAMAYLDRDDELTALVRERGLALSR
jgi:hypothetical protein